MPKGQIPWIKGKHHTKETREKISKYFQGRMFSKETRAKISKALTGKKLSDEHKYLLSLNNCKWNKGKHWTDKVKDKISKANLGKHKSLEARMKMSIAKQGHIPWNKGKHFSIEVRKKISDSVKRTLKPNYWKGKTLSDDHRQKLKKHRRYQIFPLKDTKPEIKIQSYLKELDISFLPHKYIKDINHSYQCDIYVYDLNLVIECDGDYWHGNPVKYMFPSFTQYNTQLDDAIRTYELKNAGYKVLRLYESNIKQLSLKQFKQLLIDNNK